MKKLCECGCGQEVKKGNRFIRGHSSRGKNNPMYGKKFPIVKKIKIPRNCEYCQKLMTNKRFCSCYCAGHITGKISGKKSAEVNRKNKTGCYFDRKLQSKCGKIGGKMGGKRIAEINRKLKRGSFFNEKLRLKAASSSGLLNKKNKTGIFGISKKQHSINSMKAVATNRRNKTGFFDFKVQSKGGKIGGKIGGPASILSIINNKPYIFNSLHFFSKSEMEIGINIHFQFEKLILGKNYQVKVDSKLYDFLIEELKTFIEYHPWDRKYTLEEYYKLRRDNLNKNGYKDYELVVIK